MSISSWPPRLAGSVGGPGEAETIIGWDGSGHFITNRELVAGAGITIAISDDQIDISSDGTTPMVEHNILDSGVHSDSVTGTVARGDLIVGQEATAKWKRFPFAAPSANGLNVFGSENGDVEPEWKSLFSGDSPAEIVAGAAGGSGTSVYAARLDHTHKTPSIWGKPYQLWQSDGDAVGFELDEEGHAWAWYGVSAAGTLGAAARAGRSDAQIDFSNGGSGHAMIASALLQNPPNLTSENAWSAQGYTDAGVFVQMSGVYSRWGDASADGGWSVVGLHPNTLGGGGAAADIAFEVYGGRGIGMFLGAAVGNGGENPPASRYLLIKRTTDYPSICGTSDLVLDGIYSATNVPGSVFLNRFNPGDVDVCLGGGTMHTNGAFRVKGISSVVGGEGLELIYRDDLASPYSLIQSYSRAGSVYKPLNFGATAYSFDSGSRYGSTPVLYLDGATGKVGVGISPPACAVDVANGTVRVRSIDAPTSGAGLELMYRNDLGSPYALIQAYDRTGGAYKPISFGATYFTFDSGSYYGTTPIAFFDGSNGRSGFGTNAAARKVDILDANPQLRLSYSASRYADIWSNNSGDFVVSPYSSQMGVNCNPACALDVYGGALRVQSIGTGVASGAGFEIMYRSDLASPYSLLQSYDRTGGSYKPISFGASTFEFVSGSFYGSTPLFFMDGATGNSGFGTSAPVSKIEASLESSATTTWANIITATHTSTGTPTSGFGGGFGARLEDQHGDVTDTMAIVSRRNDPVYDAADIELHTLAYVSAGVSELTRVAVIDGYTKYFGLGTPTAPTAKLHVQHEDSVTNALKTVSIFEHYSTGETDDGFGIRSIWAIEDSHGGSTDAMFLDFYRPTEGENELKFTIPVDYDNFSVTSTLQKDGLKLRTQTGYGCWITLDTEDSTLSLPDSGIKFYATPFGGSRTNRQNVFWDESEQLLHVGDKSTIVRIGPVGFTTPEGGFGNYETAGETLVKGEVVCYLQGGTSGRVYKCPTTGDSHDMPIGVVYANASTGSAVKIIKFGLAEVLPEAGLSLTMGYVITTSTTTAGRVTNSATPSTPAHWSECGHPKVSSSGNGVLTMCNVHFN
jgi:hypothetical protein